MAIKWEDLDSKIEWITTQMQTMKSAYSPNWKGVAEYYRRQRLNSIILKQNAQLRKDGYTGPFLGACLLDPPPKN